MSDTYTKLFSSITESTVWGEPYATRIVWVTMLAMADASGDVYGAIPGLARRANVTLEEVETALQSFMSPDPYSRTKDDDGRRIVEIAGGWRLINHAKYGSVRNEEERQAYKREWDRQNRPSGHKRTAQSDNSPTQSDSSPTKPDSPTPLTPTPSLQEEQKQERVQPAAAPSRFAEFWAVYPNPKAKKVAKAIWDKRKLDSRCDELIAHVRLMVESDDDWRRGYVPMGSTYLNQDRWEDVPKQQPRAGPATGQPLGKQMQGVMTLEGMIRERMAGNRNSEGVAATGLLVTGPDTRS
ncbi:hypothetical protein [Pseudoxanthomonas sp.]|uniref:hypothetical protein n=1 Tax=Pseudoxanthomonas sp. TaxID=1871049 RepID=UPI002614AD9C|nr:hypothetical protein [Pseudoxanthomonas sp.]WDS36216.1 MAG: hypothetical protein O8I58_18425 [Pseudoxanthomonas sp.]